ncbi:branched-chain amino acid aminotransferase [Kitasatospora sp. NPDC058218]|uniref:branched-chain amino acid aminotransferase n=1 Tax=Kitasatospora sp. NPDC058218 TaxID=3346385 RepID=UPI0036D8A0CF
MNPTPLVSAAPDTRAAAGPALTTPGPPRWNRTPLPETARATATEIAERCAEPAFGQVFTEHMVSLRWSEEFGWHDAQVRPWGPLVLDPATVGLHYGQVIFEGLKAFRQADGTVAAFRPADHARRMAGSARRFLMPELPEDLFVRAVRELLAVDEHWVPSHPTQSLYLRPLMFATDVSLALRPSRSYEFLVVALVTEAFFGPDAPSVSVWVCERYTRAAPGGTGEAKCAGNYAPGYLAQAEAAEHDCQQVVWLDAAEHRWVEEMGGMNLFFVYGSGPEAVLVTPPLTGTLLPGVTRDSLLTLARDTGLAVEERRISVEQWRADAESGAMTETFACGTAAVVTPVARAESAGGAWTIGGGRAGPVAARLHARLADVQRGRVPDRYGWLDRLPAPVTGAS